MEWIAINQARSKISPRPTQYLEDGEMAEALERGEREPTSGERKVATKLGKKETISSFSSRCNLSIIMY